MTIYRDGIPVTDYQKISTGTVLSVAASRTGRSDVIDLWYETTPLEMTGIYIIGTGNPVPWNQFTRADFTFVGTVVTPSGLVWHVFTGPIQP